MNSSRPRAQGAIPAQTGIALKAKAGETLRVIDPEGEQVADLFCFTDDADRTPLSSGRSIDYNESFLFTTGSRLYSFAGDVLLEITDDSCGRHDFLVTPCSHQMFRMMSGKDDPHPSCLENLCRSFEPYNISPHTIGSTFNVFMNVEFDSSGKIKVQTPLSRAGDYTDFLLHRDLLIGLTACSDEGSNGGSCKPIRYEIYPKLA